jgi:ABC-2 type transport system ATP-binding protein
VSGRDRERLRATIASLRDHGGLHWQEGEPSLEDVFIELMSSARDNFQDSTVA